MFTEPAFWMLIQNQNQLIILILSNMTKLQSEIAQSKTPH